jgi:hypothetical protein
MAQKKDEETQNSLADRFPEVAPAPDMPKPPEVKVTLPPKPSGKTPGRVEPGSYRKMGLAFTAATSFIMPVIVLSVGGMYLDRKFGANWIAFVGVLLGLVVGVTALLRIVNQLSEE